MVDDAGRIDESQLRLAVERLEAASQASREEQVATNARLDGMREEQIVANSRVDAIEKEQVSMNTRLDAIEREQAVTNVRLGAIEKEQTNMNARLDVLTLRMDRLFYAIIGGTIAVSVSVLIQGFIGG